MDSKTVERGDFFDLATFETLTRRLGRLTPEKAPCWGTMNTAQMCAGWITFKHLDHHLTRFGL